MAEAASRRLRETFGMEMQREKVVAMAREVMDAAHPRSG
jgi:hypothetical protein